MSPLVRLLVWLAAFVALLSAPPVNLEKLKRQLLHFQHSQTHFYGDGGGWGIP